MRGLSVALLLTLLALAGARPALAQIAAERPDITESSSTVGAHVFQMESVLLMERQLGVTAVDVISVPALFRFGLTDRLELRLFTKGSSFGRTIARSQLPGVAPLTELAGALGSPAPRLVERLLRLNDPRRWRTTRASTDEAFGLGEPSVGGKWMLLRRQERLLFVPGFAWIFEMELPGGTGRFHNPLLVPSVRGVAEWGLPAASTLGVSMGVKLEPSQLPTQGPVWRTTSSLATQWTPFLQTFVEIAAQEVSPNGQSDDFITLDGGFSVSFEDRLAVDAVIFAGVKQGAPYVAQAFGVAWRM